MHRTPSTDRPTKHAMGGSAEHNHRCDLRLCSAALGQDQTGKGSPAWTASGVELPFHAKHAGIRTAEQCRGVLTVLRMDGHANADGQRDCAAAEIEWFGHGLQKSFPRDLDHARILNVDKQDSELVPAHPGDGV